MPGLNGTGPKGAGSKTGKGLGRCNAGKNNQAQGMGMRQQGRRFAFHTNQSLENIDGSQIQMRNRRCKHHHNQA